MVGDAADVVGNADDNFWLFNPSTGWDLSHATIPPDSPSSKPPTSKRITLATTTAPITINPEKTALIVIDMQNFFLSPAMGRTRGPGHTAENVLLSMAFPAANEAGIRIIHATWGITDEELAILPPVLFRGFAYRQSPADDSSNEMFTEKRGPIYIGRDMGTVNNDGSSTEAGRMLMRDQWNTALHDRLQKAFDDSQSTAMPQTRFHKNRISGFWAGGSKDLLDHLSQHKITTLMFTGVNTDQCVLASLQDACNLGFDTILLRDGCGTASPDYARQMVEFNARKAWGFVSSCKDLADGVEKAKPSLFRV
ncbi:isochorismatase family protein [Apodospora peruviana]|uniref:Isochorismatase family protein n=1 Tax=Apodospora peruviana TaxID=516989 RepID=A0AAE0HU42_9PEZI|nr:isochorismatase family protein [Apodospora peruviana]